MRIYYVISIFLLLLLSSPVLAQERSGQSLRIQTLDDYMVDLTINEDDTARVVQSFNIVNRYSESIIPGRAKFVLFGALDPEDIMISIGGSQRAIPEEDVVLEDGNKVVYYEIWRPISTGERLSVEISFRTNIEPQGVLFKQLDMNFGEPDITIERMGLSLTLPTGRRLTYSNLPVTEREANTAFITGNALLDVMTSGHDGNLVVEYSSLPLPNLPFHGYWLWLLLIAMSAGILALKVRARGRENKELR